MIDVEEFVEAIAMAEDWRHKCPYETPVVFM